MNARHDPAGAARRLVWRAALLVLPMVALAFAAPRVLRLLRPDAVRQAEPLAALRQGAAGLPAAPNEEAPPPKPPEAPTPDQIEAAREAQVALGRAQEGWEKVTVIMPRAAGTGADGLETLPFDGFALSVDSAPSGAEVRVDGRPLGETPLLASVKCAPGSDLKVRVEKPPLAPRERSVRCAENALVRLAVRLGGR